MYTYTRMHRRTCCVCVCAYAAPPTRCRWFMLLAVQGVHLQAIQKRPLLPASWELREFRGQGLQLQLPPALCGLSSLTLHRRHRANCGFDQCDAHSCIVRGIGGLAIGPLSGAAQNGVKNLSCQSCDVHQARKLPVKIFLIMSFCVSSHIWPRLPCKLGAIKNC